MVGLIEAGVPVNKWPQKFFVVKDNIQRRDKLLDDVITRGSAIEAFAVKGGDALLAVESINPVCADVAVPV